MKTVVDSNHFSLRLLIVFWPNQASRLRKKCRWQLIVFHVGVTGRTDIEIEISNQCTRLIANAVIYYNSAILSRLLKKYEDSGKTKTLTLITQMSPAAWRHILLNGHYTFQNDGKLIDLDALVAGMEFG